MSIEKREIPVHRKLTMITDTDNKLDVFVRDVVQLNDDYRLLLSVELDTYEEIDRQRLFHLELENRKTLYDGFIAGESIEILVSLAQEYLEQGQQLDIEKDASVLEQAPFNRVDNWYALHVQQKALLPPELDNEDTELKVGYSTRWVKPVVNTLFSLMQVYFAQMNWTYQVLQDNEILQLAYESEDGAWTCYAKANDAYQEVMFYSVFPQAITQKQMPEMLKYITLANFGLPVGNFELNLESGELRFKTSVDFEGGQMTTALFHRLVVVNIFVMGKYIQGVHKIINEGQAASGVIAVIESE